MDATVLVHLLQAKVMVPEGFEGHVQILLRWVHFLAGITWIGFLYYFNLVNFPGLPRLDAPTRAKVVTTVLPRALWWFRWSAVVTVLAGFVYWVMILQTEPPGDPGSQLGRTLGLWFLLVVATFGVQMGLLHVPFLLKSTWAFVIAILLVVGGMGHAMMMALPYEGASNRALAIAVGGGIGFFLLLNVWGVVWRAQKRFLAWTAEHPGEPPPPALARKVRQAYVVSKAGFWLTLPMLFLMGVASHYPMFVG